MCSLLPLLLSVFSLAAANNKGADYKAGVGRIIITPDKTIYLSGYAARTHASEGVLHDLWAKALALQDPAGKRAVLITLDICGIGRDMVSTGRLHAEGCAEALEAYTLGSATAENQAQVKGSISPGKLSLRA